MVHLEGNKSNFFYDFTLSLVHVSSLCLGLLSSFPQDNIAVRIRFVVEEGFDKSLHWGYFDGSAAGEPKICGAGELLVIYDDHFFTFKASLGYGTNNFAELLGLKLLLTLALDKHLFKLQIFGDSQLVINWASGNIEFRIFS